MHNRAELKQIWEKEIAVGFKQALDLLLSVYFNAGAAEMDDFSFSLL